MIGRRHCLTFVLLFAFYLTLSPEATFAAWTNGQSAVTVLGEPDFATTAGGVTATALDGPSGICIDPTTHNLWVADFSSHRMVMWTEADKLTNGAAATKVLGQPDLTSNSSATTADGLNRPLDCAFDTRGNLYVSDRENSRVLRYDAASSKADGADADLVLGQADFTSGTSNRGGAVAANTLSHPWGVFIDSHGNLWVNDASNHRVLRFDDPLNKMNGADADFVLGQADFASGTSNRAGAAAANTLSTPYFSAVDDNDTLLVADSSNNRILMWYDVYGASNGADADGVLGQVDFTSVSSNRGGAVGAGTMGAPIYGVSLDSFGGVYVSDSGNNRMLYFENGTAKSDGDDADKVIGQPDFTTTTSLAVSDNNLGAEALGAVYDGKLGRIWIPGFTFKRVTAFYDSNLIDTIPPAAPAVTGTASTQDTTPTWSWTSGGGGNGVFRYKLDDVDLSFGATETTATSYTPSSALSLGDHVLYVQERDNAGNWSSSGSFTISINDGTDDDGNDDDGTDDDGNDDGGTDDGTDDDGATADQGDSDGERGCFIKTVSP